jgi:hypothetical protein
VPKTTYLIMGQDLASTRQTCRHSPSTFARTRQTRRHSPSHVARTRQSRRHSPKAIFEKNVTRLNTFARVLCHFREFGASGHCLNKTQKGDFPDFLTTPSTPSKEFGQNPKNPPWICNYCASMMGSRLFSEKRLLSF